MMAEGLRAALATAPDIEVVGLAATGEEAREVAERERPDVVLMDYSLPATDGFAVARRMRELDPEVKVIMLTGHQDPSLVARAVEEGFDGFLRKTASVDEVIGAVRQVHGGAPVFSAHDLTLVMQRVRTPSRSANDLTEREYEVLRLMAAGTSTEGMAEALFVSAHTIRSHVRHILESSAPTQLEAVAMRCARASSTSTAPDPASPTDATARPRVVRPSADRRTDPPASPRHHPTFRRAARRTARPRPVASRR
jgi:DNA-binding NarL/FixJ family response regulator